MTRSTLPFIQKYYTGRKRADGTPYISHLLNVWSTLEALGLEGEILDCALLHDICEDIRIEPEALEKDFGFKVSQMVFFLSKADKSYFSHDIPGHDSRLKIYVQKFKQGIKMYPEIMLVKLSDQIDNLSTLQVFPKDKQERIVEEMHTWFLPVYTKRKLQMPTELEKATNILYERFHTKLLASKNRLSKKNKKNILKTAKKTINTFLVDTTSGVKNFLFNQSKHH